MVKRYEKEVDEKEVTELGRYYYLTSRYFDLLTRYKESNKVPIELMTKWMDEYLGNLICFNTKVSYIIEKYNLPNSTFNFQFNADECKIYYCVKEEDESC